ncbi:MAG: hypothetical protein M3Y54_20575 [Bacteroidota bacterium]|nr:hypothetical protein [Bacteroidota bacterium]
MNRAELVNVFYTWIVPALLTASFFYFFTILDWLTRIEQQPNRWFELGEALVLWSIPVFSLCVSGLFFCYKKSKNRLFLIYVVLLVIACGLLLLVGGLSGASPKLEN